MVNLEELKEQVTAAGEKVKTLKTDGADKAAIGAAVAELLALKKEYADNNNGIGVDGKPFSDGMSKADKKKQAKAEKGDGGGPGKQVCVFCCLGQAVVVACEKVKRAVQNLSVLVPTR